MPIQFRCRNCQGWIEVDNEHAGGKAACPFCQAVNPVPAQSEPSDQPPGPGPYTGVPTEATRPGAPEVPVSKPLEPDEAPRRLEHETGRFDARAAGLPAPAAATRRLARIGMLGLAGAIVSVALIVILSALVLHYLPPASQEQILQAEQMSPEQRQEFQRRLMLEFSDVVQQRPWIQWLGLLSLLLWGGSLMLNLGVIFWSGMHRRTYAWAGLAVNTLVLFACVCSIMQR